MYERPPETSAQNRERTRPPINGDKIRHSQNVRPFLELIFLDSQLNVYAGKFEVRPPGAPTTASRSPTTPTRESRSPTEGSQTVTTRGGKSKGLPGGPTASLWHDRRSPKRRRLASPLRTSLGLTAADAAASPGRALEVRRLGVRPRPVWMHVQSSELRVSDLDSTPPKARPGTDGVSGRGNIHSAFRWIAGRYT